MKFPAEIQFTPYHQHNSVLFHFLLKNAYPSYKLKLKEEINSSVKDSVVI